MKMSTTKEHSVLASVAVLLVVSLAGAGPVKVIPHQTAARQQGGAVLFFASYQGSLRDIEFNPIIFGEVSVNQGSAYSNDTGVFTAPTAGIYQFVFAAQLCRGEHNNMWCFMVNEKRGMLCHAQVSGGDTTLNTCFFMGKLQTGDQVRMRQERGSCAWASTTSRTISFSGVLLSSEGVSTLPGMAGSGSSCPLPRLSRNMYMTSNSAGQSAALSSVATTLLLTSYILG